MEFHSMQWQLNLNANHQMVRSPIVVCNGVAIGSTHHWTTVIHLVTVSIHPIQDLHSHVTIIEESNMMLIQLPC